MHSRLQRVLNPLKKGTFSITVKYFIIFFLLCQGCMAYRSHDIPDSNSYEHLKESNFRARLIINANHWANGHVVQQGHKTCLKNHKKIAMDVFRKAGLFREIGTDVHNPDIEITINTKEEEIFSSGNITLCGLTIMIFPGFGDVVKKTEVKVSTPDGKNIANYSAESHLKVIIELLLIPTIPTFFVTAPKSTADLYQMVVIQMKNDPAMKPFLTQFSQNITKKN